jgi:hypothetical protein
MHRYAISGYYFAIIGISACFPLYSRRHCYSMVSMLGNNGGVGVYVIILRLRDWTRFMSRCLREEVEVDLR